MTTQSASADRLSERRTPTVLGSHTRRATPRFAVSALTASVALIAFTAALGPSAVEPDLPGAASLPPYTLVGHRPSDLLVVVLLVGAILLGATGLLAAVRALDRGWQPRLRTLAVAGLVATSVIAVVPSIGSADPESYAAYGHIAATGHDPYATTPAEAYRRYADRVAAAVQPPWQNTTSVYGPLATGEQTLAALIGRHSVRTTVAVLAWISAGAFLATGLLLLLLLPTASARRRAAVLWLVNPLLLLELVAGAHLDVLVALALVGAVALTASRTPLRTVAAGAAFGLAIDLKATAAIALVGAAWMLRSDRRTLGTLITGALVATIPAYLLAGPHVLHQARRAARLASSGTPWRWVASAFDATIGKPDSRAILGGLAALITLALLVALLRHLHPRTPAMGALAGYLAYTFAAPYVLPWYDGPAWALLAASPRPRRLPIFALLLAHTGALAAAYVTLDQPMRPAAHALVLALRSGVAPVTVLIVLAVTVMRCTRAGVTR